jgi:hypothetical protein
MSGASTPTPEHVRCGTHGSLASHACWGQVSRWSAATDYARRGRPGFGHRLRWVWQQHLPNPSHQQPEPATPNQAEVADATAPESQERREIGYAGRWQSPRITVPRLTIQSMATASADQQRAARPGAVIWVCCHCHPSRLVHMKPCSHQASTPHQAISA